MRSEAVANQNPWFVVRPCFGLGIKDTREPVQADLGVGISRSLSTGMHCKQQASWS